MRTRRLCWIPAALLTLAFAVPACGSDGSSGSAGPAPTGAALSGALEVSAASSLTEAFTELGKRFEVAHPGVDVTFNFAASSTLARQVNDGNDVDVLATADEANMEKVTTAGNAVDPRTIARNRLAIIVGRGNPKAITGLADLGKRGVVFVVCAPEVPCGAFASVALTKAGVTAAPASLEENVKAVVSKVTLDEADAGIVYVTDVKAAGAEAEGVDIDIAGDPRLEAVYPIAIAKQASHLAAAKAWIAFVLSDEGQEVLTSFGFRAP